MSRRARPSVHRAHAGGTGRRIVVTGAGGFIGSAVARASLARHDDVVALDRASGALQRRRLDGLRAEGAIVVEADLTTADLARLLDGADAVVHLAGRAGVAGSWGDGRADYARDNVLATLRLLDAVVGRDVRVVVASSSSVYGDIACGVASEDTPLRPLSPYATTKVAVEHLMGIYVRRGVDAVALRYFSVYGRDQRPDMAISRLIDAALLDRPFPVRGDGTQQRDVTHIDDVVRATLAAAAGRGAAGSVLNVGGGCPVSLLDIRARLQTILGKSITMVGTDRMPGEPARTSADIRLTAEVLGWQPQTSLEDGLADQLAHHRIEAGDDDGAPPRWHGEAPVRHLAGRLPSRVGAAREPAATEAIPR